MKNVYRKKNSGKNYSGKKGWKKSLKKTLKKSLKKAENLAGKRWTMDPLSDISLQKNFSDIDYHSGSDVIFFLYYSYEKIGLTNLFLWKVL